ncbi:DUF4349 domain-containing protein [Streptomyces sp. C10-9-1]|uniref:DUF4349 domain-containing protein n=1 Tax=Streptomyces sp. C10-9-1 TaxID=1859285 RepID=UPI0021116BF6|nr:DUF4349 domain-containing protein [Streptomyces sp. C10-9-1]MCQ6551925.1 DUF4349 domain-containing protein [Streptomyces sp. C10-9-1]
MRAPRAFAVLMLSAVLGLTGCGASDSADSGVAAERAPAGRDLADSASGYAGAEPGDGKAGEAGAEGPEADRAAAPAVAAHLVRTAVLEVEVADAAKALAGARAAAEGAGGRVESESTERLDDSRVTSRIVLRVPQERYEAVLDRLSGAGRLLSRQVEVEDVTDQVVDVDSRVATQRASVQRVRELMDRATRLSDVVSLEGELSRRQAELESLLARQKALGDRTSMATVTLELTEAEPSGGQGDGGPGFLDALGGGWRALVAAAHWAAVAVGAVLPFAVVAGVLLAAWRLLVRLRRPRAEDGPAQVPGPAREPAGGGAPSEAAADRTGGTP